MVVVVVVVSLSNFVSHITKRSIYAVKRYCSINRINNYKFKNTDFVDTNSTMYKSKKVKLGFSKS